MMMSALYAGLIKGQILYQKEQEKIGKAENGYDPNPSGLHEVGQAFYMQPEFSRNIPDNSLVKILFDGLPHLAYRKYKIAWMFRDVDEINMSCERVDRHLRQVGVVENPKAAYPFDCFRPYDVEDMNQVFSICQHRKNIQITPINFSNVIENPVGVFKKLKYRGWPIDPEKCAAKVNPKFYRYRNGTLDEHCKSRHEGTRPESNSNEQPTTQE